MPGSKSTLATQPAPQSIEAVTEASGGVDSTVSNCRAPSAVRIGLRSVATCPRARKLAGPSQVTSFASCCVLTCTVRTRSNGLSRGHSRVVLRSAPSLSLFPVACKVQGEGHDVAHVEDGHGIGVGTARRWNGYRNRANGLGCGVAQSITEGEQRRLIVGAAGEGAGTGDSGP